MVNYIYKTNRNFKTKHNQNISEIKLKKTTPNSNFVRHVKENNYNTNFVIDK